LCVLFFIYSIGYFEFSVVWPCAFLILILLRQKWHREKKNKREIARAMALGFEKEILLNGLPELPSWVNFPDIEKVEWLNKVFKLFWERINLYIHDLIPKILEPAIQSFVEDFKFDKVILGNVPLRIDGVKVYEQDSTNKIVMDVDISYAGDCYVTFQTFKFTGGIKDIQLHGRLRVVMTPIISKIPLIGGLQVYFMNEPRIDFDLIKFTQILDLPVIRNKIENTIMKIINSMFLFPNVYSIKLNEGVNMSKLTIFRLEGILRVHVVEAKNLVNKDIIGKSDPYTVLSIGSVKVETHVIQNSLNPKWDFWTEFEAESNSELRIQVWDQDEGSKDEPLGHAIIDISKVADKGEDDLWIKLQDVVQGTIHIRLTWLNLSANYADLDAAIKETEMLSPHLHTALLMIYVESSENLPKLPFPPSPYVELLVEGTIKSTDVVHKTCNPMWDKGFTFMIRDPKRAILDVKIFNEETKMAIGDFSYKIDKLKDNPNMEFRNQQFFLNTSNKKGSLYCSMKLRIFKNQSMEEESKDEVSSEVPKSPRKTVKKQDSVASTRSKISQSSFSEEGESTYSENNTSFDFSTSDLPHPYVKLYLHTDKTKSIKKKTKSVRNTAHPVYNETFEYLLSSQDLTLTSLAVVVASEKRRFDIKKKFLGRIVIDLSKCANFSEPFTDWFNLKRKDDTD
ncbi:extended synaptotagmin-2, partial [Asbolus verrucosus]